MIGYHVNQLIQKGANIHQLDKHKKSALNYAIPRQNAEYSDKKRMQKVADLLIKNGANPEAPCNNAYKAYRNSDDYKTYLDEKDKKNLAKAEKARKDEADQAKKVKAGEFLKSLLINPTYQALIARENIARKRADTFFQDKLLNEEKAKLLRNINAMVTTVAEGKTHCFSIWDHYYNTDPKKISSVEDIGECINKWKGVIEQSTSTLDTRFRGEVNSKELLKDVIELMNTFINNQQQEESNSNKRPQL